MSAYQSSGNTESSKLHWLFLSLQGMVLHSWVTTGSDIRLHWSSIHPVYSPSVAPTQLIDKFGKLFTEELGTIAGYHATFKLRTDARPKKKFHGARPIPFAIKPAIDHELDKLEASGVIEKVSHSSWAAPTVIVPKKNGKFRICGDYSHRKPGTRC